MRLILTSGNEIGPFRAIEESIVAHLTSAENRSDVYAWYSLSGNAGAALGLLTCGWVTQYLHQTLHWETVAVYRVVFYGYAGVGLIKAILVLLLSAAVEAEPESTPSESTSNGQERTPLLRDGGVQENPDERSPKRSWIPAVSHESIAVVSTLCTLFALDSFASGLASL